MTHTARQPPGACCSPTPTPTRPRPPRAPRRRPLLRWAAGAGAGACLGSGVACCRPSRSSSRWEDRSGGWRSRRRCSGWPPWAGSSRRVAGRERSSRCVLLLWPVILQAWILGQDPLSRARRFAFSGCQRAALRWLAFSTVLHSFFCQLRSAASPGWPSHFLKAVNSVGSALTCTFLTRPYSRR